MAQEPSKELDKNAADAPPMRDEADIGSGEKTPAERETDAQIRQIPPLPEDGKDGYDGGPTGGGRRGV